MEKFTVLECFAKVRQSSPDNIKNEVSFNLLEDLSKLYISVRTFLLLKAKFRLSKAELAKKKSKNQHLSEQV